MKKLNIYIARQIFIGFLLVTFSLMSILWLTQSLRFVELVTNKGLPLSLFIKMTSCLMPRLFALLSPISLFCSGVVRLQPDAFRPRTGRDEIGGDQSVAKRQAGFFCRTGDVRLRTLCLQLRHPAGRKILCRFGVAG